MARALLLLSLVVTSFAQTCGGRCDAATATWAGDGNVNNCDVCIDPNFLQDGALSCLSFCPTGFTPGALVCENAPTKDAPVATLPLAPAITYSVSDAAGGTVIIKSGTAQDAADADRWYPAKDRGVWFGGASIATIENLSLNHNFAIVFWMLPKSNGPICQLATDPESSATDLLFSINADGKLLIEFNTASLEGDNNLLDDTWIHVSLVTVWDAAGAPTSQLNAYLNGSLENNASNDGLDKPYHDTGVGLHKIAHTDSLFLQTFIYQIKIWNASLEQTDVAADYALAECTSCSPCAIGTYPDACDACDTPCDSDNTGCVRATCGNLCADEECAACDTFEDTSTCSDCSPSGNAQVGGDNKCACNDGFGRAGLGLCQQCFAGCKSCSTGGLTDYSDCTVCNDDKFPIETGNGTGIYICLDFCPDSYTSGTGPNSCAAPASYDDSAVILAELNTPALSPWFASPAADVFAEAPSGLPIRPAKNRGQFLNGESNYFSTSSHKLGLQFSFQTWISLENLDGDMTLFSKERGTATDTNLILIEVMQTDGTLRVTMRNAQDFTITDTQVSTKTVSATTWTLVTVNFDTASTFADTTVSVKLNDEDDGAADTLTLANCYFLEADGVDYAMFVGAHRPDDSTFQSFLSGFVYSFYLYNSLQTGANAHYSINGDLSTLRFGDAAPGQPCDPDTCADKSCINDRPCRECADFANCHLCADSECEECNSYADTGGCVTDKCSTNAEFNAGNCDCKAGFGRSDTVSLCEACFGDCSVCDTTGDTSYASCTACADTKFAVGGFNAAYVMCVDVCPYDQDSSAVLPTCTTPADNTAGTIFQGALEGPGTGPWTYDTTGITLTAGANNKPSALRGQYFTGTDSTMTFATCKMSFSFSFQSWIRPDAITADQALFQKSNGATDVLQVTCQIDAAATISLQFASTSFAENKFAVSAGTLSVQWHYVEYTATVRADLSGTDVRFSIDVSDEALSIDDTYWLEGVPEGANVGDSYAGFVYKINYSNNFSGASDGLAAACPGCGDLCTNDETQCLINAGFNEYAPGQACDPSCDGKSCRRAGPCEECAGEPYCHLCFDVECVACTTFAADGCPSGSCTKSNNAEDGDDAGTCKCQDGMDRGDESETCNGCHTGCETCTGSPPELTYEFCTACKPGKFNLSGGSYAYCVSECPSGYDTGCVAPADKKIVVLNFDVPSNTYVNSVNADIATTQIAHAADSASGRPVKGRGIVFDGTADGAVLQVNNLVFNLYFGVHAWVYFQDAALADATIFSKDKNDFEGDTWSHLLFGITGGGELSCNLGNDKTGAEGTPVVSADPILIAFQAWTYVIMNVEAVNGNASNIILSVNNQETFLAIPGTSTNFMVDKAEYPAFIGSRRGTGGDLGLTWNGFIYELTIFQDNQGTFNEGNFSDSCSGDPACTFCPTGECLPTYPFGETEVGDACGTNWEISGCIRTGECPASCDGDFAYCALCADAECSLCNDYTTCEADKCTVSNLAQSDGGSCSCTGGSARGADDLCESCAIGCETCSEGGTGLYDVCSACKSDAFDTSPQGASYKVCSAICPTEYTCGSGSSTAPSDVLFFNFNIPNNSYVNIRQSSNPTYVSTVDNTSGKPISQRGIYFDGSSAAYIDISDFKMNHSFSVQSWLRSAAATGVLLSKNTADFTDPATGTQTAITFGLDNANAYVIIAKQGNGADNQQLTSTDTVGGDDWNYVVYNVLLVDGNKTEVKFFINNVLDSGGALESAGRLFIDQADSQAYIGARKTDVDVFGGQLDAYVYDLHIVTSQHDTSNTAYFDSDTECPEPCQTDCAAPPCICPVDGSTAICLSKTIGYAKTPEDEDCDPSCVDGTCVRTDACVDDCAPDFDYCHLCDDVECKFCEAYTGCTTCGDNSNLESDACVCDAAKGAFRSAATNYCVTCHTNCLECTGGIGNYSDCVQCNAGAFVLATGGAGPVWNFCTSYCPTGGTGTAPDCTIAEPLVVEFRITDQSIANLVSGNSVAATITSASPSGMYAVNRGLYFDGVNAGFITISQLELNHTFAINYWIMREADVDMTLFSKDRGDFTDVTSNLHLILGLNAAGNPIALLAQDIDASNQASITASSSITLDQWAYVNSIFTMNDGDKTTMAIAIDNAEAGTETGDGVFMVDQAAFNGYFGLVRTAAAAYAQFYKGYLYELQIYNGAFTPDNTHFLDTGCTEPCTICPAGAECLCEEDEKCEACDETCLTCLLGTADSCLSCYDKAEVENGAALGSCVCVGTAFPDTTVANCADCDDTCGTCAASGATECQTCKDNAEIKTGTAPNECECSDGFFPDTTAANCSPCDPSCATCSGAANTECQSCPLNSSLVSAAPSECECATAFWLNDTTCEACSPTCNNCSGAGVDACEDCLDNAEIVDKAPSACGCSDGFFPSPDTSNCAACSSACATCSALGDDQCQSCGANSNLYSAAPSNCVCSDGFWLNNGACDACDGSCLKCSAGTAQNCTDCNEGAKLNSAGEWACKDGYFGSAGACTQCDSACLTCSEAGADKCNSCRTNNKLATGTPPESCVCDDGYFGTAPTCDVCDDTCLTCSTSATNCESCKPNAELDTNNPGICICSTGFAADPNVGNCVQPNCDDTCNTCSGSSAIDCDTCKANATKATDGSCQCNSGAFRLDTGACDLCHSDCTACTGTLGYACTACVSGKNLWSGYGCFSGNCASNITAASQVCTANTGTLFTFEFNKIATTYTDSTAVLTVTFDSTQPPKSAYLRGAYFDQDDFATTGNFILQSAHTMSLWVRHTDYSGRTKDNCVLTKLDLNEFMITLCYDINGKVKLSYVLDPFEDGQVSEVKNIEADAPTDNTWSMVRYTFSQTAGDHTTAITIDSGTAVTETHQGVYFKDKDSTFKLGGQATDNYFKGFIYEWKTTTTAQPPSSCSCTDSICSSSGVCLSTCTISQFVDNNGCSSCQSGCDSCSRSTNCSLPINDACAISTEWSTCTGDCHQRAFKDTSSSLCSCTPNSTFDGINQCTCNTGFESSLIGTCEVCEKFLQASDLNTANFSTDFASLAITFNRQVDTSKANTCALIFDATTLEKLGTSPECYWSKVNDLYTYLTVRIGKSSTIVEESITLNNLNMYTTDDPCTKERANLVMTTAYTAANRVPVVVLEAPVTYSSPCSTLDMSGNLSTGHLGRAMLYKWAFTGIPSADASKISSDLGVESAENASISIATNTFTESFDLVATLTVKNSLGESDSTSQTISVTTEQALSISFAGTETFKSSYPYKEVIAEVSDTCGTTGTNPSYSYTWTYVSSVPETTIASATILATSRKPELLLIPANSLPSGAVYTFNLSVRETSGRTANANVALTVSATDLIARINRLSGEVSNVRDLVLSGADSEDPDNASAELTYSWTGGNLFAASSEVSLTIPQDSLVAGTTYTITLTVTVGTRTASTSITITVVSQNAPDLIIDPPIASRIDTSSDVIIQTKTSGNPTYSWTKIAGDAVSYSSSTQEAYLVIAGSSMSPGETYIFQVQANFANENNIKQTVTFTANTGPRYGDISVSPTTGTEMTTKFSLKATSWEDEHDDQPLTYAFLYRVDGEDTPVIQTQENPEYTLELPAGSISVWVKVCDSLQTCTESSATSVSVTAASEDAITTIINTFDSLYQATSVDQIPGFVSTYAVGILQAATAVSTKVSIFSTMLGGVIEWTSKQLTFSETVVDTALGSIKSMTKSYTKEELSFTQSDEINNYLNDVSANAESGITSSETSKMVSIINDMPTTSSTSDTVNNMCDSYLQNRLPDENPNQVSTGNVRSYMSRTTNLSSFQYSTSQYTISLPGLVIQTETTSVSVMDMCITDYPREATNSTRRLQEGVTCYEAPIADFRIREVGTYAQSGQFSQSTPTTAVPESAFNVTFTIPVECDLLPLCVKLDTDGTIEELDLLEHNTETGQVICSSDEYARITLDLYINIDEPEDPIETITEKISDDDDSDDGTHYGPIIATSSLIGFVGLLATTMYLFSAKGSKTIVEVHSPQPESGGTHLAIENSLDSQELPKVGTSGADELGQPRNSPHDSVDQDDYKHDMVPQTEVKDKEEQPSGISDASVVQDTSINESAMQHYYVESANGKLSSIWKLCLMLNLTIKNRVIDAAIIILSVFMFQYAFIGVIYYIWDFRDDNYDYTVPELFSNIESRDMSAFFISAGIGIPLQLIYLVSVKNMFKIVSLAVIVAIDIACFVGIVLLTLDLPAEASAYWTMFFIWLLIFDLLVLEPLTAVIKYGLLKMVKFKY